jgi:hypothetical protein
MSTFKHEIGKGFYCAEKHSITNEKGLFPTTITAKFIGGEFEIVFLDSTHIIVSVQGHKELEVEMPNGSSMAGMPVEAKP